MKIWIGHGSEHSSRLVLIGHFRDAAAARSAEERLHALTELALRQPEPDWEQNEEWFDEETRRALESLRLWQISPGDLDNFRFEHDVARNTARLEIETEEYDVQGIIKVLILQGARIEVYSRHDWVDDQPADPPDAGSHDDSNASS